MTCHPLHKTCQNLILLDKIVQKDMNQKKSNAKFECSAAPAVGGGILGILY